VQSLFEAVRLACAPAIWSRGVELARAEAVCGESDSGDEVALRVATRGGLVCPVVLLHPEDAAWDCDCSSRDEVCEHVAAAVIALRRARAEGRALPEPTAAGGRLGYRLRRSGGGLEFERVVVGSRGEEPLRSTLSAITSGRSEGPRFAASRADLLVESAVGARRGELPRGLWPALLAALRDCPDVTLDGEPVRVSDERVGLRARIEDAGAGFRLAVGRDPRVREVFREGVALRDDTLCLLGQASLTGRELEDYGRGRVFAEAEVAELVTEVLPALEGRLPIDRLTGRLPETVRAAPRLLVAVERRGEELSALATLVYGDPPLARVDAGRLVALGSRVPLRDLDAERALTQGLQRELGLLPGHRATLAGAEAVELAARLRAWRGGELDGSAHQGFFPAPPLEPHFALSGDDFELRFASRLEEGGAVQSRAADPERVLSAWRAGESLVPLAGGGLAPLPADWLARYGDVLSDLLLARRKGGELPRCLLPDLAHLCAELGLAPPPAALELRALLQGGEEIPAASLPADLSAQLRTYQRRGADWLCWLRDAGLGALLADDMGLGKTLQALCALRGRSLVVAPTSVLPNWAQEIARFRPGLWTRLYHGPRRALDPQAAVTLTSYAILRLDAEALAAVSWDAVVLDEAQAIKNPESQVARAAFGLQARFRLALSGTPVENRLEELWSQLHFANPGLLGSRRSFDERTSRPIAAGDEAAALRLRRRIRPFVLRRTKREVAPELPPRTEVVLHPELSPEEQRVYDAVRAATRREVVEKLGAGTGALAVLEALLRLRQAACHPALVPGQEAASSSKVELLLEVLDETVADGHKSLVFSQWTSLLDLVEPHLRAAGIAFARLDGSTRDRGAVVAGFQDPGGPPVLLASLKAGGLGLNLTAADHVFILDPWWNPAAEDQAADRAHRIGQDRPVMVYRLVTQGSVEERILALQEEKRRLARVALEGAGQAASVTREELLALLD